jgi:hypothetical protein
MLSHSVAYGHPQSAAPYRTVVGLGMVLLLLVVGVRLPSTQPATTPPPQDVSLVSTVSPSTALAANELFEIQVVATNHDRTASAYLLVSVTLPPAVEPIAARTASGARCEFRSSRVNDLAAICPVYDLMPGASVTVIVQAAAPATAGEYQIGSMVELGTPRQRRPADSAPSTNAATATLTVRGASS